MHFNILLLLLAVGLLTACGDSSDYAMPPEYDYTPAPEPEKPSKAPSTSSLLDIAISAGSEQTAPKSDDTGNSHSDEVITPTITTPPATITKPKIETVATVSKPAATQVAAKKVVAVKVMENDDTDNSHSDELVTPTITTPVATIAKPKIETTTTASKPAATQAVAEKVVAAKAIEPSQAALPPPPNKAPKGIKELDFSAKEHSPAKITTVKLDNTEVTHRGKHSQSLYSSSTQGRFHKTNKHGTKIQKSSNSWSCVIDNKNGLLWEGKSQGKWRNSVDQYVVEGGNGSCKLKSCSTQAYVNHLNQIKLCGRDNWQLPSKSELASLTNTLHEEGEAAINLDFFPNTQAAFYWSHSPFKYAANRGWTVDFSTGHSHSRAKSEANHLRLVSKN